MSAGKRVRLAIAVAVGGGLAAAAVPAARADTELHIGVGSDFGRGLGLAVERGGQGALVLGAGVGGDLGYSSVEGWIWSLEPGVSAGYRRYLGGWYLGPSLGLSYRAVESDRSEFGIESRTGTFAASALLDGGHRFNRGGVGFKLGLSGGLEVRTSEDSPAAVVMLTLGVGVPLR